jgi:hypothetical protein
VWHIVVRMRAITTLFLLLAFAAPSAAKTYSAERFDARIRVLPGGAIEVVETVVFRFEDGSFTYVFREIPTRRTDGVEILGAEMDGRPMPFGTESGQVEVRRGARVHVRWHFAPRSESSHSFVLRYTVRGVVKQGTGTDLLEWLALPAEHNYRIDTSEIVVVGPASLAGAPGVESRRVSGTSVEPGAERVQILGHGIAKNGWIKARLEFPAGSVIAASPLWQQRQQRANALAPRWLTAAALLFAGGLMLFFALRQGYDSPPGASASARHAVDARPDTLRPALAGALASNGRVSLQHAMSAFFTLGERGAITITEEPRKWGQRTFMVHRQKHNQPASPEEAILLRIAFRDKDRDQDSVPLDKARRRVGGKMREFRNAVREELRALGFWHDERASIRSRYLTVSVALLIGAGILLVPGAVMASQYGGWALLPAAAVAAAAIVGCIFYGAVTPLSNEGIRRGEAWTAYQKHLKNVAREKVPVGRESPSHLLAFAVALGLAGTWSKFAKHHPGDVPPWFHTMTASDAGAFSAFIAAGGAGDGGGAGVAAGGAAGGGSSGAG